ncbi:class I SAM-dependent methyltransferase [Candidatus Woesearchaeota archaeon]|nr:class I SAM-dependent methyltransferase [Candidatus Woesearchaeota archaeon]
MNTTIEDMQRESFNRICEEVYFNRWKRYKYYAKVKENITIEILNSCFKKSLNELVGLEIACGIGHSADYLNSITKKTVGLDISDKSIELARVIYPKTEFVLGSATNINYENEHFDFVVIFVTFNHFNKNVAEKVIREANRILKPGGVFVICEPNIENIFIRILLKFLGVSNNCVKEGNNFYKLNELKSMLLNKGFIINFSKRRSVIPYPFRFIYSPSLDFSLSKTFPMLCGYFAMGASKKAEDRPLKNI